MKIVFESLLAGDAMTAQEIERAIIDNEKLVYYAIHRFFPDFQDDEDVAQAGFIGLWKACISYDDSKTKFSTYAVRCIMNEIRAELRHRAKLWKFGDIASLDEPVYFDKNGSAVTLAHLVPDSHNDYHVVDYDLSFLNNKLSKRDIVVFKLSIYGFTATEIANMFGYTKAWASKIITKAQALCRKLMANT
jgi:RNA polymerase sigma factor (sigma-70 family)